MNLSRQEANPGELMIEDQAKYLFATWPGDDL
jgi:hypothetical protein